MVERILDDIKTRCPRCLLQHTRDNQVMSISVTFHAPGPSRPAVTNNSPMVLNSTGESPVVS